MIKKIAANAHLFFIPEHYRTDEVIFRKCKVFINTTLVTSIFAFFFLGNAIMFKMPMALIAMIVCSILFFMFAWALKFGIPYKICTNSYIFLGVVATAWDAYFAGGLNSIHTPWFVFPAIGAILIGTIKEGRIWMMISVSVLMCFGIAAITGYVFPNELADEYKNYMALSGYAGLIIILFIVVLVVENAYLNSLKKLNTALDSLKKSQAQLIHQEKLASLGHLTAGIAHEIKNPLNFVNNFAQLSVELIDELETEQDIEARKEIFKDIKSNLGKIKQHGNRADFIVKSMLLHSRSGKSEYQETDINKICEEYLNLAYHGARAADKDFNCKLDKDLAPNLPFINCLAQDISRVILNLLSNAMYAVKGVNDPTVGISTSFDAKYVHIDVKDNGGGMTEDTKKKLFEPFYTTKPTGQGTGLGLSISFDIIKAHGGIIDLTSELNKGTTFRISLPIKK